MPAINGTHWSAHTAAIDPPGTPLRHTVLYRLRATRRPYPTERTTLVKFTCLYASRHIEHSRQAFSLHVHLLYSSISSSPFCSFYLYVDKEVVYFPSGNINDSGRTIDSYKALIRRPFIAKASVLYSDCVFKDFITLPGIYTRYFRD